MPETIAERDVQWLLATQLPVDPLLAMAMGALIIIWSLRYLHTEREDTAAAGGAT